MNVEKINMWKVLEEARSNVAYHMVRARADAMAHNAGNVRGIYYVVILHTNAEVETLLMGQNEQACPVLLGTAVEIARYDASESFIPAENHNEVMEQALINNGLL